jgi:chromate transporter
MLDGLGLAETTPGPLIMVTQFVGFLGAYRHPEGLPPLLAATLGGILTTWVTFVPCFLWIFLGAPFVERLRHNRALAGALAAITAAVVGVILNLALWFALHYLFGTVTAQRFGPLSLEIPRLDSIDPLAALLSAAALVAILRLKLGILAVIGICGIAGAMLKGV